MQLPPIQKIHNRSSPPIQLWFGMLLFVAATPIREVGPTVLLWAAPCLLFAALAITWGAESTQFFIAQGFALAILALLQTLPDASSQQPSPPLPSETPTQKISP